jgi:hypothetical protein
LSFYETHKKLNNGGGVACVWDVEKYSCLGEVGLLGLRREHEILGDFRGFLVWDSFDIVEGMDGDFWGL